MHSKYADFDSLDSDHEQLESIEDRRKEENFDLALLSTHAYSLARARC